MAAWNHVGLLQLKTKMIYLSEQVCLIIIHTNTAHILDMSRCHQHQQQSYHDENTRICMFTTLYVRYVDILFPLTKSIPIMFERVTKHYQTLQTWMGHDATRYYNFNALQHALPHVLPYICHTPVSQFNMTRL